jgi:hypothetical protein
MVGELRLPGSVVLVNGLYTVQFITSNSSLELRKIFLSSMFFNRSVTSPSAHFAWGDVHESKSASFIDRSSSIDMGKIPLQVVFFEGARAIAVHAN